MKRWFVRVGLGLGGLFGVLLLVGYLASESQLHKRYVIAVHAPLVPTDPTERARGEHLVKAVYDCAGCDGADQGGMPVINDGAVGRIMGCNLTGGRGGIAAGYRDEDWARAIRHGVGHDGHALLMMSADAYEAISDRDLGAAIAYLRSLPAVDREKPHSRPGPIGRILFLLGLLPIPAAKIDHVRVEQLATPTEAPTAEYGQYPAKTSGCPSCHGDNLAGKSMGSAGRSSNITPAGIGSWSEQAFATALRRGIAPGGRKLGPMMPAERAFSRLTELEIKALWLWSRSLPAVTSK